jgi:hypothetical protein
METRKERLRILELVWDAGLDFAGAALRGGCSLDEAANGNPYRKNPLTGKIAANDPKDPSYIP